MPGTDGIEVCQQIKAIPKCDLIFLPLSKPLS
ncbi:hypothetical protein [Nostoc sp. JL31]